MKTSIFLLAFMAWIECTIAPHTQPDDDYTLSVKSTLMNRLLPPVGTPIRFDVHDGDQIVIRKVIAGQFMPKDIVHGILRRSDPDEQGRGPEHPPPIEGQHGRAEVTLGIYVNHMFHAALMRNEGYENHEPHTTPAEFFCTIQRGQLIFLAAVLRRPNQPVVPIETPRVRFLNHPDPDNIDAAFTGQLFMATRRVMKLLLASL